MPRVMEQYVFMQYKNKLIEGSSEKVNKLTFYNKNNVILMIVYCLKLVAVFIINIFAHQDESFGCKLVPAVSNIATPS
jgi:hypothetical protein